ncbi:homocysteine S-methyltransferase family protein [uncultured Sphingomonas sp.]|uniref:homocysteine S-methyltransferase family protein n=1 Tax=uncultured Sphingomonas sp. TaxID=158754 RepID=UPI002612DA9E|nr:homocysteine S-methyltransferase family protein [uncultured Sphingomonas sp.]
MTVRDIFNAEAAKRILITDGAFGTEIQGWKLSEADYAGNLGLSRDQKGNNDILALTKPEVPEAIHRAYFEAGADIAETNTFSANSISQADYGAEHLVREINVESAKMARRVADEFQAKDGRPRFVAGAIGPTNKTLSLSPDVNDPGYREIDFDYLKQVYREQIDALVEGGVDFVLIETVFDTLNAKAGIMAAIEAGEALGRDLPIMLSMTLTDLSGRNLSGHAVEAFWHAIRHARPLTVGLNCSFGAEQLRPHVKSLSEIADTLIMVYPNAGLPNELGAYDEAPATTAGLVGEWAGAGQVNVLGGCCGSTPAHIKAIADAVRGLPARPVPMSQVRTRLAGLEPFTMAA